MRHDTSTTSRWQGDKVGDPRFERENTIESRARSSNDVDEDDDSSHDCTLGTAGVDCRTLAHRGPGSGGREHADVPASRRISPPPP